jgi:hypothetical protein
MMFETTATITDQRSRVKEPTVTKYEHIDAERTTIYVPGFHADGPTIGPMFLPAMQQHRSNLIVVGWDKSGNRPDIAKHKIVEALDSHDDSPLSIHASSWGFHPFSDWAADPEFRDRLNMSNRDVTVVGDSNFYDTSDISRSTRQAMEITRFLPPTFTSGKLFELAMGLDAMDVSYHDENVSDQQIRNWKISSKKAPYGAARSQVQDIRRRNGHYPWLKTAYQDVDRFRFVSARHDGIANPYTSFAKIQKAIGEDKSAHYIDTDRYDPSHAAGPAFSRTVARLLFSSDDELSRMANLVRMDATLVQTDETQTPESTILKQAA